MDKLRHGILRFTLLIIASFSALVIRWTQPFPKTNTTTLPTALLTPTSLPTISAVSVHRRIVTQVRRVIDGDTIQIETGETVRYIGIDSPETVNPNKPAGCFGKEASEKNKLLTEGKSVELEKDISEKDRYGRQLRYVWLDGIMINELLVREGYAVSSTFPPDVKYQDRFVEAQKQAREEHKGLWGKACGLTDTP